MATYAVYPYFIVSLTQIWVVDADSEEEALQQFEAGEFVREELTSGNGELIEEISEAKEISDETAEELLSDDLSSVEVNLTQDQQEFVEDMAENNGIDPQDYVGSLLDKALHHEMR